MKGPSRKRILVTGGTGFLGSNLCERLVALARVTKKASVARKRYSWITGASTASPSGSRASSTRMARACILPTAGCVKTHASIVFVESKRLLMLRPWHPFHYDAAGGDVMAIFRRRQPVVGEPSAAAGAKGPIE